MSESSGDSAFTRRRLLGAAGAVAGRAAVVGTVGAATASVASADQDGIAAGPPGTIIVEFLAQITQTGGSLTALGYLNRVAGLSLSALFSDPGNPSESTALFTAVASGNVTSRVANGGVTVLDLTGTLDVYHRSSAGASFANAASFSVGTKVAGYALVLQDVLAVVAPDTGVPTLTGDLKQTSA